MNWLCFQLKRFIPVCIVVLALGVQVSDLSAQERTPRAKLEQFKKMKLIEVLDMESDLAEKFFIVYNEGEKNVEEARSEVREAVQNLHETLENTSSTDKEIAEATEKLMAAHKGVESARNEMIASIKNILSTRQFAQFVLLEARFWNDVKQRLEQMRGRRGRR